jgi:hypothetical protein
VICGIWNEDWVSSAAAVLVTGGSTVFEILPVITFEVVSGCVKGKVEGLKNSLTLWSPFELGEEDRSTTQGGCGKPLRTLGGQIFPDVLFVDAY